MIRSLDAGARFASKCVRLKDESDVLTICQGQRVFH